MKGIFLAAGLLIAAQAAPTSAATLGITEPDKWGPVVTEETNGQLVIVWVNTLGVDVRDFHVQIMEADRTLVFTEVLSKTVFDRTSFSSDSQAPSGASGRITNFYEGTLAPNAQFLAIVRLAANGPRKFRFAATTDGDVAPPIPLPAAAGPFALVLGALALLARRRRA